MVGKLMLEAERLTARVAELAGTVLGLDDDLQAARADIEQLQAQLAAEREENETLWADVERLEYERDGLQDIVDLEEDG